MFDISVNSHRLWNAEYHSVHAQMAWSQRFRKSEISLDTGMVRSSGRVIWINGHANLSVPLIVRDVVAIKLMLQVPELCWAFSLIFVGSLLQHECIQVVVRAFGIPSHVVECIADIYARNTTVVRTAGGVTGEIPVGRGARQCCPLSDIVFNLVDEVLVRGVKAVHNAGYKFTCADVFAQVLMYAEQW